MTARTTRSLILIALSFFVMLPQTASTLDILGGRPKPRRIVRELAESGITAPAEEPSHLSAPVVVIHRQPLALRRFTGADGAHTPLALEHRIVLFL